MRDNLFNKNEDLVKWSFDEKVSKVFDDMVVRSVPGYRNTLELISLVTAKYGIKHTNFYDLGCSTGAAVIALNKARDKSIKIIAVDNSKDMIKHAKNNLNDIKNIEIICDDIKNIEMQNASIVVLNWTLQFINPDLRQMIIDKIYKSLVPKGLLILSEKLKFSCQNLENTLDILHLEFKKANGYTKLEIANKRQMLDNVLISDDENTHINRLTQAGFTEHFIAIRNLNFATFIAIK